MPLHLPVLTHARRVPPLASRSAQSNEVRFSRLKCLQARDEAMQSVLAEAAGKLPSLTKNSSYGELLESLITEVRTT